MQNLDGLWEMIRAETGGEPSPDLVALHVRLELRGEDYRVTFAGQLADRGTFTSAGAHGADTLTLLGIEGPNRGRTIPCRYQQVGDRLRICYGLDGTLPADFTTAAGQSRYLATYRRV